MGIDLRHSLGWSQFGMVEGTLKMSFGMVERGFKKFVGKGNLLFRRLDEGFLGRDRGEAMGDDVPDLPMWILGHFCCNLWVKT